MSIYIGNAPLKNAYVGDKLVKAIYKGSKLIWSYDDSEVLESVELCINLERVGTGDYSVSELHVGIDGEDEYLYSASVYDGSLSSTTGSSHCIDIPYGAEVYIACSCNYGCELITDSGGSEQFCGYFDTILSMTSDATITIKDTIHYTNIKVINNGSSAHIPYEVTSYNLMASCGITVDATPDTQTVVSCCELSDCTVEVAWDGSFGDIDKTYSGEITKDENYSDDMHWICTFTLT